MIMVDGGSADPIQNLQLAGALKRARDQGIPKENIEKALAKVFSPNNELHHKYSDLCLNPVLRHAGKIKVARI